jgi:trehalose 6-phosphate phosphatase
MLHLFEEWTRVRPRVALAKRLLAMLDFDGTLSPIVEHPEQAAISQATRLRLEELAAAPGVTVAVITGRAAEDVRLRVGLQGLDYIGNHGRERITADRGPDAADAPVRQQMAQVAASFESKLEGIPGTQVENKGLTVAVHYRRAPRERRREVREAVAAVIAAFGERVEASEGKCVFDIVPADQASKGSAALALLEELGGLPDVLPVYCGDDTTDETAFIALPEEALTVRVGREDRFTAARFRLDDPDQVAELLGRLANARRETEHVGPV